MKKGFSLILCMALAGLLSGCGVNKINQTSDIENTFDSDIKVSFDGKEYECELSHTAEQVNVLKLVKPNNLAGLTFSWQDGVYEVSWNELRCEFSKDILPDSSFASSIVDVLNSIKPDENLEACSSEGEHKIFRGSCNSGKFEIYIDKDGFIRKILIPERDIKAELYSFNAS